MSSAFTPISNKCFLNMYSTAIVKKAIVSKEAHVLGKSPYSNYDCEILVSNLESS